MLSEKGLIFFPIRELEGTPQDYQLGYEDAFFPAADSTRLHGWFVPSSNSKEKTTLLWFHGNAGNISHRLENLALLHRHLDISIFLFDYREFGLSQGQISKAGTYLDAQGSLLARSTARAVPSERPNSKISLGSIARFSTR